MLDRSLPRDLPEPASRPAAAQGDYEIGPRDIVHLVVIGQDSLTGDFAVDPDGMLTLPLLGKVKAADLTPRELERKLTTLLADGYLKRPQLYSLDAGGWFDTGDLARMDAEGYIRICGRSKDVIIRGGENIPVVEIESALYRIPAVADAAVVAMPDPRLQERACAFVTLREGKNLTLADICRHLAAEGFSKHFWPERLEVIELMPRTATGKIQKFVLRETAKKLAPPDAAVNF